MEPQQESFWLASEARHAARLAWWRGVIVGATGMFAFCVFLGLFIN
jgi:hypothetical protein